ncbi:MAG: SpoIIE family protein phosphatase, partial [Oscillospiraceae bacterium]
MSIYDLLLDGVELLLLCAFCMLTIDYTLGEKSGKKKRFSKWLLTVFSGVLLQALVTIVITNFETYVNEAISQAGKLEMTLDVLVSLVYALYNAFQMLLPTFISLFAAMWLYKQQKSIKIFTTVLVGLGASIIFEYVYGIAILPFSSVLPERMVKIAPPIFLSASILALILGIFYVLYRRKLYEKLKNLLDTPDGRVDSFVKIPVISNMIFALLISTLHTFGIYLMTRVWSDVMIYIVVFGCLIFIYILMYWSIFKGITLSTQSMRNRAELDVAKHIQESVLPNTFPAFPQRKEFLIHASMDPAKEVGGDFYDFFFTDENHLAVVIADVSGKGIPAALFMMTSRTLLKNLTTPGRSPEKVLTEVNNLLCENNETEMFVTAWLGIVEVDTGRL